MTEGERPAREAGARKACCLVSEIIEEAGLDRETARAMRKQLLQGVILFCQWQLERMDQAERPRPAVRRTRRVAVD